MRFMLNVGSGDVLDEEIGQDDDFGFCVEFSDGRRLEVNFDAAEGETVRCVIYDQHDSLSMRKELVA